jgi:hypothetical protein
MALLTSWSGRGCLLGKWDVYFRWRLEKQVGEGDFKAGEMLRVSWCEWRLLPSIHPGFIWESAVFGVSGGDVDTCRKTKNNNQNQTDRQANPS